MGNRPRFRPAGFTLVEMVIAIVITGILGGIVAVFISAPIEGYVASVRRADLTDAADGAFRRIARDVRTALPNSLRATGDAVPANCFEFLPTVGGGRYRAAQSDTATGDILDFSTADASFDVLAGTNLPNFAAAPHHAVIYNLGIPGADAYNPADLNRAGIRNTSTAANIVLTAANQFPFASPGSRFNVIPDFSVAYSCSGGNLIRSTQAIAAAPLAGCPAIGAPATSEILVGNVAACAFSYVPAVSARNGLLTMTLVLTQAGESVRLYQEVHVNNVP
jgi:MSHA biogenesis protein MshO